MEAQASAMSKLTNNIVKKVYVVFKTHLDVGFTDFAASVEQQYIESFIPAAMQIARQMRVDGGEERFVWTTGSWLIDAFLESAKPAQRKQMEAAILAGDIAWHGLPFTMHSELLDASLFEAGLEISRKLDTRFGKHTIAAKMTDVPGHTRAIVPLLAHAGIRFLHIGVNAASTPPDVPDLFVWRHTEGSEVIVMYDKAGYGGTSHMPGMASALSLAHTNDNMGPGKAGDVRQVYERLRRQFPAAEVVAARLDDYANDLIAIQALLPVVTGEIGDTWIHGAGTDPAKVARYRELSRLRREWLDAGVMKASDQRFDLFSRFLLLVPEHTWGMDEKTFLGDYTHYDAAGLRRLRRTARCRRYESSWAEQRQYIEQAIAALGGTRQAKEARSSVDALQPVKPSTRGWQKLTDTGTEFDTTHFTLSVNENGAIQHLVDKRSGKRWASLQRLLGLFRYETFTADDYARFGKQYVRGWPHAVDWAVKDFTKPGMENSSTQHVDYLPRVIRGFRRTGVDEERFLFELRMPDEPVKAYGCPARLTLELVLPAAKPGIEINLQWFNKQACRLPEAIWYSFQPVVSNNGAWWLSIMDEWISPLDVVRNGNRNLHGTSHGVRYVGPNRYLHIDSLDAPLVAPGQRSLLDFSNRQPALSKGIHFNLYNNVWGTNFPMWYDDDARFRFALSFVR